MQLISHGPGGGSVTSVNLATQEISVQEGRRPVAISNGLLVTRDDAGLLVAGPDGEIAVRHADQVAATDPLIVHGPGGILRLDRDTITSDTP